MQHSTFGSRPQRLRMALLPADPHATADALVAQLRAGGPELVQALRDMGLAPLWRAAIEQPGLRWMLPQSTLRLLSTERLGAAARYLAQKNAVQEVHALFEKAGIAYAVMKGAAIREVLHVDPSVLQAGDIDLLVDPKDRLRAAAVLVEAGYCMHMDPANISHEVTLKRHAEIDLHWNILRPGRTRVDLTAELLARRVMVGGFWTLSPSDSMFLALTHPAFAKYVCSPNMGLARVLSFLLWFQKAQCDWPLILDMLRRCGLNAAAWTMLGWYIACAPAALVPALTALRAQVQLNPVRAAYLEFWLRHDLPTRLINHSLAIQFGLTVFLHDGPCDALQAFKGWYCAKRDRLQQASAFYGQPAIAA